MYLKFTKVLIMIKIWSFIENKNLKINSILIEKYKDMLENPNFEQNYWSKTAEVINKVGHDSIRLMKWICYYDRSSCDKNKLLWFDGIYL